MSAHFASQLVMKGIDLTTVKELLGHKDIKMTLRYAHLAPTHIRKVVDVLDQERHISGIDDINRENMETRKDLYNVVGCPGIEPGTY